MYEYKTAFYLLYVQLNVLTPYIKFKRSARQGCPLSAMLYTVWAQPLTNMVMPHIQGINKNLLLYLHADVSISNLHNDKSSEHVMDILEIYCAAFGAKVNCHKTTSSYGLYKTYTHSSKFQFTVVPGAIQIQCIYVETNMSRHLSLKGEKLPSCSHCLFQDYGTLWMLHPYPCSTMIGNNGYGGKILPAIKL